MIKVDELKKFSTYIIAEIGINHNGSLEVAKQLIDVAKNAGCDAVKFQKRNPDIAVPESQKSLPKDTPWGQMPYIDYKHKMEFWEKEFDEIDRYCKEKGIEWSASVWDLDSVEFMKKYDVPFIKIPSAKLTDDNLIKSCVDSFSRVIMSTGMSTFEEINHAANRARIAKGDKGTQSLALLHCNSSYPAPLNELNLAGILELKSLFTDFEIGYSGHEFRIVPTVASIYLGATILERHITLDRSMWGTDQLCSIEPQGLIKLVKGVRELEEAYGEKQLGVTPSEVPFIKKLRG